MHDVLIAIPCYGDMRGATAWSLADLCYWNGGMGRRVEVKLFGSANQPLARDALTQYAIAREKSHVLWLDADSTFPPAALDRLLAHQKAIVGCNFAMKRYPIESSCTAMGGERLTPKREGLERVECVGFGMMLCEADVFRKLPRPWFLGHDGSRYVSNDSYFCERANAAGIECFVDHALSAECGHVGLNEFRLEVA